MFIKQSPLNEERTKGRLPLIKERQTLKKKTHLQKQQTNKKKRRLDLREQSRQDEIGKDLETYDWETV